MTRVKICGIRTMEEAGWAVEAGADALGFIFAQSSKRYISPQVVREISGRLTPFVSRVGVFVNSSPSEVEETAKISGLTAIQMHGDENPDDFCHLDLPLIKAVRPPLSKEGLDEYQLKLAQWSGKVRGILIDSVKAGQFGGTGHILPWQDRMVQKFCTDVKRAGMILLLAGGLNTENVCEGIAILEPDAVDVSSGVESNGRKDRFLVERFIKAAKGL